MVSVSAKSINVALRNIKLSSFVPSLTSVKYVSTTNSKNLNKTSIRKNATQANAEKIPPPHFDGQEKTYPPKIHQLVDEIAKLNLLEVADLNELLRKKLNIKDMPVSYAAFAPGQAGAPAAAAPKQEEEAEPEAPKAVKSSFKLKLVKFDEGKKVALIKEIKAVGENMNLVQAKKFVESAPQVVKDNIAKEEAEKLKAQLEKVGAVCEIE
jgi:large subunit ribosomal protein L7/L12